MLAVFLTPIVWPLGVALLWLSPACNSRLKLIGTLVLPGGLAPAALLELGDRSSCPLSTAGAGDASCVIGPTYAWVHPGPAAFNHVFGALVFLAVLLAPIVAAGWLALRLRWTSTGHRSDPGPQRGRQSGPVRP